MQAMEVGGGGSSERGVTGGEPSNFRANDRGYDQIFGVWARGQGESEGQNWDDIMSLLDADLRDNHACTMASLATQHAESQQGSSAGRSQSGGCQMGGGQSGGDLRGGGGGGGEQSSGPKRPATPRQNLAKKQRLTKGTF